MRAKPSMKDIKVLIVSANLTEEIERAALLVGANRCLQKPFSVEDIFDLVGVDARPQEERQPPAD